jgi:hypothetical protein
MVKVFRCGLMELGMKVNGKIIELMAKASSCMLTVTYTKETGSMIRPTGMVSISMSMVQGTKVLGKTTYSMVKEKKLGLMAQYTKVNIDRVKSTDLVYTVGTMDPDT